MTDCITCILLPVRTTHYLVHGPQKMDCFMTETFEPTDQWAFGFTFGPYPKAFDQRSFAMAWGPECRVLSPEWSDMVPDSPDVPFLLKYTRDLQLHVIACTSMGIYDGICNKNHPQKAISCWFLASVLHVPLSAYASHKKGFLPHESTIEAQFQGLFFKCGDRRWMLAVFVFMGKSKAFTTPIKCSIN